MLKDRQLQNFHIIDKERFHIFRREDRKNTERWCISPSLFETKGTSYKYDRIIYQLTRKVCSGDLEGERGQQQQQFTHGPYIFHRRPTMRSTLYT